jgi:predicted outer membrane repeat protein
MANSSDEKRNNAMKRILQTLSIVIPVLASLSLSAQIVYVAPNGTGNGTSWANATGNLKTALDNAVAGTQIWVKKGTYRPTTCTNCTFDQRNLRFQVKNGVKLYGGFAGTETSVGQRNITANPTYLSGDIDQDGQLANNSFTIVYTTNVSNLTLVDGFIITGGNADYNLSALGTPQNSGAGWFNVGSTAGGASHPVVRNCRFENNYAWGYGGGMFNDGSFTGDCHPTLENCVFSGNTSRTGGGGMYNSGSFSGHCSPVLTDCFFENNESLLSDGGGMFNIGSEGGVCNPSLTNCTFTGNSAFNDGGALYSFGKGGNSSPIVQGCIFEENEAGAGGAVYNDGTFNGFSGGTFTDCHFTANHSSNGDGGAMYNSGFQGTANPELMNCLFENNHSAFAGAAIFNNGVQGVCNPSIANCRFLNNMADTYGGAIYNQGKTGSSSPKVTNCLFANNMALSAGAIYNLGAEGGNANAIITNCTFYGNHANVGGAVYCNAGEQGTGVASPAVRNCIFWGNTAGEGKVFRIIWGTPTISNSLADVADCQALYNGMGGSVNCGSGLVFNQNPMFVSPAGENFHLMASSPIIDSGNNDAINQTGISIDLDKLPRIFNNTVDMGVYEFGSMVGTAPAITQNPENQEVCEGETATFSVSATGSQPLVFQWLKNGNPVSGANQSIFTLNSTTLGDAGGYSCKVTNGAGETVTSDEATLTVNEPAIMSLTIAASQTEICSGEEVTLTASPANGGAAPVFQWFINGNAFGGSVSSFNISQLNDGDTFTCEVISSETCISNPIAFSNPVVIHVENTLTASLAIVASLETACEGQPVEIFTQPVNGGNSPSYQWLLNGNSVGANSPSLTIAMPQNGDQIQCMMTSSKNCVAVNPVSSNMLTLAVAPVEVAAVEISPSIDTTFCRGTEISFTATIENGGGSPAFQWQVNGQPVGGNQATFTTTQLENGDAVSCLLTSNLACVEENPALSNEVVVEVDSCVVLNDEQTAENQLVWVYPNPTSGKIFVEISESTGIFATNLLNTQGQNSLSIFENHPVIPCTRELNMANFPKGIYYLQIITDRYLTVKKIVLE